MSKSVVHVTHPHGSHHAIWDEFLKHLPGDCDWVFVGADGSLHPKVLSVDSPPEADLIGTNEHELLQKVVDDAFTKSLRVFGLNRPPEVWKPK